MKVKITEEQIKAILDDPKKVQEAGISVKDPWWVVLLKVIAYAIGLILGGVVTTSCSNMAATALFGM